MPVWKQTLVAVCCAISAIALPSAAEEGAAAPRVAGSQDFDAHLAPLFARRCLDCHNASDRKGGLDLTTAATALAGGDSGPVIQPGKPEESLLWQRVAAQEMPPERPLREAERQLLHAWIASGAAWGTNPIDRFGFSSDTRAGYDWWSLAPVSSPAPPAVKDEAWPIAPLDRFILARLEAQGMAPAPATDKRTLIRRVTYDLVGLPPTPAEVAGFVDDESPRALERVVDRLLASPHYGERWARHWLDVVRFGESQGFEYDRLRPAAYRYRDWLIAAFNDDLPYDQFTRLQLAGDVLAPGDPRGTIATGFLTAGAFDQAGQSQQSAAMRAVVRQDELEDIVGVTAQTFLGLTANCARCHDHKFDPIRQTDYYRLVSSLSGARHANPELQIAEPAAEFAPQRAALDERSAALARELAEFDEPARQRALAARKSAASAAHELDAPDTLDELLAGLTPGERQRRNQLVGALSDVQMRRALLDGGPAYAVAPREPEPTSVLARGNPAQPLATVGAGGVAALAHADFQLSPDAPEAQRRVKLAAWITDPANPLTARVVVNRLWHYHFGIGLVDTPNDFGFNGGRPSHPELLDWLAGELVRGGWSLKHLHRRIVLSGTYRQSSGFSAAGAALDADNRLLWRKGPVRLDAEAIRDAMLSVSGGLNGSIGGPSFQDFHVGAWGGNPVYQRYDPVGFEWQRRSVYRMAVRGCTNRFLDAFDCPDPSTATPRRVLTTTPLQALAALNNSFVLRMCDMLAQRLADEAGAEPLERLRLAYELCFARPARPDELSAASEFVRDHGLAAFCRVLLNSSEFVYVD